MSLTRAAQSGNETINRFDGARAGPYALAGWNRGTVTQKKPRQLSKDGSHQVTTEVVNTVTHLAAAICAVLGGALLIVDASVQAAPWKITAFSIYSGSLICLFAFSALHHGVNASPRVELTLRQLDYMSIFLLIAGTYTAICLSVVRSPLGWTVVGVVWAGCAVGMALRAANPALPKWVTMTFFGTLGWFALALVPPLLDAYGWTAVVVLAAGGLAYTVGGVVYVLEKPNPVPGHFGFHEIWHLFVIAGSAAHYAFIYLWVRPG